MELVDLGRVLWRRRLLVSVGLVLALLLVGKTLTKPRPAGSVMSWTRVIIDTKRSQLVTPDPDGMDSLIWRAHLLADQMTSQADADAIARGAGLEPDQVRVQEPLLYASTVATPLPVAAQKAASIVYEPYVVTLQYAWNLPVIEVDAVGPDRATTVRLATSASNVLAAAATPSPGEIAASAPTAMVTSAAQDGKLPADQEVVQQFTARPAAAVQTRVVPARSGRMKGIMLAAFVLVLWCIVVPLLPERRRRGGARAQIA